MKICYVSCSNIFGGVENVILQTLNELCKSDEVALVLPAGAGFLDKFDKRVKIYEYKSFDKRYNIFLYLELAKILKNYDLIHSHGAKATQICYVLSKFMPFKFIATKHNIRKGKIFNRVKNVIAVSSEVAKTINHETKILNFGIRTREIERKLADIFTISAVGRLDPIKGFDRLIAEVSKLRFPFILQIVGDGSDMIRLQNLAKELGIDKNVKFLGFRDDIAQILANSHLQVISSVSEGFSLMFLEGINYANLLISTPVGIMKEHLSDDFLIKDWQISENIMEIYKNYDNSRARFAEYSEKIRADFTLEKYISNLSEIYKGLK